MEIRLNVLGRRALNPIILGLALLTAASLVLADSGSPATENKTTDPQLLDLPSLPAEAHAKQSVVIGGKTLDYTVTVTPLPIRDEKGRKIAEVVCTSYSLDGNKPESRPVTFAMNGGPGSASLWLNLGCLGPKRVQFGTQGDLPSDPIRAVDNPGTWLPFTDLVFIDPVGTGYSRALVGDEEAKKRFWNMKADVAYLSRIIYDWLVAKDRMTSPKYLVGESYGGYRAPRLAFALESDLGVGLSGLIMVSPYLDAGATHVESLSITPWIGILPTYAAAHLERLGHLTPEAMAPVEAYAVSEYASDLLKGYSDPAGLDRMAKQIAEFTGLPPAKIKRQGGRVQLDDSFRERFQDQGLVTEFHEINRTMPDPFPWQMEDEKDWTNPMGRDVAPAVGAIVDLYGRTLAWKPQARYYGISDIGKQWENGERRVWNALEATHDLRRVLALDPKLRVIISHGYTDGVCPYFFTKLILSQTPSSLTGERIGLKVYPGGHMFYNRPESMMAFLKDAKALYGIK